MDDYQARLMADKAYTDGFALGMCLGGALVFALALLAI